MNIEELKNMKFHFVSHLSMIDMHITTYASDNNQLGWCDYVPFKNGEPKRRACRHYRIGTKIYKTREKFMEAIKDYNPK